MSAGAEAKNAPAPPDVEGATALQNRMMWRGQPGHYEVWYITLSHRASGSGFWIRYTLEAPTASHGQPYAQLWFCRGDGRDASRNFGINQRLPIASLATTQMPFEVRMGDSRIHHAGASGALEGHGHRVRWDLRWRPSARTHLMLPASLYKDPLHIAETLVLSPNVSVPVSGFIEVDGERYELSDDPAGQTHVWGRKHAYAWAWGHCNSFDIDGQPPEKAPTPTVLETLSVRMRRGPVVLPLTLFAVYPDGLDGPAVPMTEWSDLPFSRSDYRTGHYSLSGQNLRHKVEATFSCQADDMVRSEYLDPDGTPAYCHFAAAASCQLTLWRRGLPGQPWQLWRKLRSDRGAQFEWGGRAGDSLVKRRHMPVDPPSSPVR